jgi:hypothetical protein
MLGINLDDALSRYTTNTPDESDFVMEVADEIVFRHTEATLDMLFQDISNESASHMAGIPLPASKRDKPNPNANPDDDIEMSRIRTIAYNRWLRSKAPKFRWIPEPLQIVEDTKPLPMRKTTAKSLLYCLNHDLLSTQARAVVEPVFKKLERIVND